MHGSPAMRLYRHALESILGSLNLHDLSQILAVSREWSAAVRSMKSIGATIDRDEWQTKSKGKLFRPLPPIERLVAGPLLRHVAGIQINENKKDRFKFTPLTSESLALLAQHAPNLTSLWCDLTLTPSAAPLILPAHLISLQLRLLGAPSADEMNRVLVTVSALPCLQRLVFRVLTIVGVDLSLLGSSPSLRDLSLENLRGAPPQQRMEQLAQIRSSLGHLQCFSFGVLDSVRIARLLQPPVSARWQDIGLIFADADTGDLLVTLPTLTRLDLTYGGEAPQADFLSKLPLLSALHMQCYEDIPAASVLAALLPCTGLTDLALQSGFSSSQVSSLLAALTNLKTFKLNGKRLESLQCFASGPATRTLEELCINKPGPALSPSELVHLHALKGLRSLELSRVFESLDDAAMDSLSPPTARLPRLTRLAHTPADALRAALRVERTGPSFEWMQQRLTQ